MRSDQQQNNERLIRAGAALFEQRPEGSISLADIARQADVSVATAYRHFESVDDVLSAYRRDIGLRFRDEVAAMDSRGMPLVQAACLAWVRLVFEHGTALVHRRSTEGFLPRFRRNEPYMTGQIEALARPLGELIALLGFTDVPGVDEEAAMLWNVLFDPREVFDLRDSLGLDAEQISRRLVAALRGALAGWETARLTESLHSGESEVSAKV